MKSELPIDPECVESQESEKPKKLRSAVFMGRAQYLTMIAFADDVFIRRERRVSHASLGSEGEISYRAKSAQVSESHAVTAPSHSWRQVTRCACTDRTLLMSNVTLLAKVAKEPQG